MSSQLLLVLGVLVFSAVLLRFNSWRALLFLKPSRVQVELEAPADQMKLPDTLAPFEKELLALGFSPIGSHAERASMGPEFVAYDYANPKEHAFATLYASRFGQPRLYFMTATEGGGFVVTANFRRPSRRVGQSYLAGGLPNVPAERLLKTHQKRLEGFRAAGAYAMDDRLAAARAWFAGPGRWEIRLQNLNGLVSSVLSAVLFVAAALAAFAILARR